MRSVPQNLLDAIDEDRTINARVTIRDTLPRFEEVSPDKDKAALAASNHHHSSVHTSGGILRISQTNTYFIKHMYESVPTTTPWDASWVSPGIEVKTNSYAGLFETTMWYQDEADGYIKRRTFASSWSAPTTLLTSTSGSSYSIRPVAINEAYMMYHEANGADYTFRIVYRNHSTSTTHTWKGCIYATGTITPYEMMWFSAVRATDKHNVELDYIFFRDEGDKNSYYMTHSNGVWSDPEPVIPIDVVDDMSNFVVTGATIVEDKMVVTGIYKRKDGPQFQVYLFGPPPFTMGKEFYITDHLTEDSDQGWSMPAVGGQLHAAGTDQIWYVAPGIQAYADKTYLFGNDMAANKTVLYDLIDVSSGYRSQAAASLSFDIPNSETHSAIRPGSEVTLEMGYAGEYAQMGVFEMIPVIGSYEPEGQSKSIMARSKAMQRIGFWVSDSDYILYSQAKAIEDPGSIAHNIRISGKVEEYEYIQDGEDRIGLEAEKMNEDVIIYSVARPSRNWIATGKFYVQDSLKVHSSFGLIMNYYHGLEDAADYGIAAIWKDRTDIPEHRLYIYHIYNDVWTELTSVEHNIVEDAHYWLKAEWHDGNLRVLGRQDGSATWNEILDYTYNQPDNPPWKRERLGRCGFYLRNSSQSTATPEINAVTNYIPLESGEHFAINDLIVIDDEVIQIKEISPQRDRATTFTYSTGYHVDGAQWDNAYKGPYSYYGIWATPYMGSTPIDHLYYDGCVLYVVSGPGQGHSYGISQVDYSAPRQWYIDVEVQLPDTWFNHIGDTNYGHWDTERADHCRIFVHHKPDELGPGSTFKIMQGAWVTRGVSGTTATWHIEGEASLYATDRTRCDEFYAYSTDQDLSIEEVAKDIARKANVLEINSEKLKDGNVALTNSGWDLVSDFADTSEDRANFIFRMRLPSMASIEVGFVSGNGISAYGSMITFNGSHIKHYKVEPGTTLTLLEQIPWTPTTKWIKVSQQEGHVSIWNNGRLVATFHGWEALTKTAFASNGNITIYVDWAELDDRARDFIYELGGNGTAAIDRLISEKRVFYQDDQYGALRLFRSRTYVNESDPYVFAISAGEVFNNTQLRTRIRGEGFIAQEQADLTTLREYGNLFLLARFMELTTEEQFEREIGNIITDISYSTIERNLTGAADPRIEPNDKIEVTIPSGTKTVIVESINFQMSISRQDVVFDMEMQTIGDL